jgi:predicted DNA-binding transcriptional regulator YafY
MKLDRMLGIVHTLAQVDRITARELAGRFEVSLRTIHRDVEAICMADIPLVTYPGGHGGIALAPGYKLDKKALTEPELRSILTGLQSLESIGYESESRHLRSMLAPLGSDRITPAPDLYIDLASYSKDRLAPIIRTLRDAIAQRKVLRLAYLAANGATERLFEPYYIAFRWSAWYVAGWCRLRGAFRMFRINRIVSLSTTDLTYAFRDLPASAMDPDRMFHQEHTETAVLLVHPSAEFKLLDAFGPDSYQADASGWLRFSFPYVNHDWMLGFIFSLADKARVLSPEALVRTVSERAQAMARLYDVANP